MLAEINFLRLEAMARTTGQRGLADRSRFVLIFADAVNTLRERQGRENGKRRQSRIRFELPGAPLPR